MTGALEATLKLVLWDIDHTLIATRGVGREIFADAFEQATGTPMREQATADGMTEPVIFHRTAQLHGITSDRTMFDEFARRSTELHRRRARDLRERGHALPGAAAALATLAAVDGVMQSVVTGNIRAVAETKLQVFGLDTHIRFPYGGYGDEHDDRAELVRTAIARTRAPTGAHVALADVLLIGDTSADVAAGRAADVPVLAVATGRASAAELADAGATATINDLHDVAPLHDLLR